MKKSVVGVISLLLLSVNTIEGGRVFLTEVGSTSGKSAASSAGLTPKNALSRMEQLQEELHINDDPNEDIRTNVILNLEWGI